MKNRSKRKLERVNLHWRKGHLTTTAILNRVHERERPLLHAANFQRGKQRLEIDGSVVDEGA